MVLGRPSRSIARAQDRGQGLARGVEEGDHGRGAEAVLVVRRRTLLVRVGIDQRGVDVDHVEARVHPGRPGSHSSAGPSSLDALEGAPVGRLEGPPHRRHRRHVAEEARLVAEHAHVAERGCPIGNGDGHVDEHVAAVMAATALLGRSHGL